MEVGILESVGEASLFEGEALCPFIDLQGTVSQQDGDLFFSAHSQANKSSPAPRWYGVVIGWNIHEPGVSLSSYLISVVLAVATTFHGSSAVKVEAPRPLRSQGCSPGSALRRCLSHLPNHTFYVRGSIYNKKYIYIYINDSCSV